MITSYSEILFGMKKMCPFATLYAKLLVRGMTVATIIPREDIKDQQARVGLAELLYKLTKDSRVGHVVEWASGHPTASGEGPK